MITLKFSLILTLGQFTCISKFVVDGIKNQQKATFLRNFQIQQCTWEVSTIPISWWCKNIIFLDPQKGFLSFYRLWKKIVIFTENCMEIMKTSDYFYQKCVFFIENDILSPKSRNIDFCGIFSQFLPVGDAKNIIVLNTQMIFGHFIEFSKN